MAKHNKKRNTAFIYEVLVREIIKQTINKNTKKRDIAIEVIKERFKKGAELRKELELYKAIMETKNLNERVAEKLMFETKKQYSQLDQEKIFKEQNGAISSINKKLSKDVFNNFVPNYKNLATLSQIFGATLNPKTKILLETKMINSMSVVSSSITEKDKVPSLVMKTFTERFNETYKDLLEEQKTLLSHYVSSFQDDGAELRFFANEEVGRLKKIVEASHTLQEVQDDDQLKEKLHDVQQILDAFNKQPLNNEAFLRILKLQSLADELQA